ncbi:hypothetical protein CVS40_7971 [Lucilia cuprina]|nr:hypothetical protein CVS40_7971 [Lucilia cuprina]
MDLPNAPIFPISPGGIIQLPLVRDKKVVEITYYSYGKEASMCPEFMFIKFPWSYLLWII